MADDPMWCLVMFDLPVKTKKQRSEANQFRHLLLDEGYWMAQLSIYVRYSPTVAGEARRLRTIRRNLPEGGQVRILYVTDREWSKMICYQNQIDVTADPAPDQLTIF